MSKDAPNAGEGLAADEGNESSVKRVTINIPDDLYEAVVRKAESEDRTMSSYVRALLRRDIQAAAPAGAS